jgi:uncharacterized peroxidase-related enzyme
MPRIALPDLPGIRALMTYRPETSKPLNELADVLLRGSSTLSRGERELIGAYVSSRNDCRYCCSIHSAIAARQLEGGEDLVEQTKPNLEQAAVSGKMKALLAIAGKIQQGGKNVTSQDIERARKQGATDLEIHDTVQHVQPLRGRPRHPGARRPRFLSRQRRLCGREGLCRRKSGIRRPRG